MSSAENNQTPVAPNSEIDGLKVKEAVNNASLHTNAVTSSPPAVKAVTTSTSADASSVTKSSPAATFGSR
jgi:hypothetical protein